MEPGDGAIRPLWPRNGQTLDTETRRTVWCVHPWPARQAVVLEGTPLVVCVSCGAAGAAAPVPDGGQGGGGDGGGRVAGPPPERTRAPARSGGP